MENSFRSATSSQNRLNLDKLDDISARGRISLSTSRPRPLPLISYCMPHLYALGLYCLGHAHLAYCICTALVHEVPKRNCETSTPDTAAPCNIHATFLQLSLYLQGLRLVGHSSCEQPLKEPDTYSLIVRSQVLYSIAENLILYTIQEYACMVI